MTAELEKKPAGIVAEFDSPASLIRVAETLRDAGYQRFDCHSPFPIHGMDRAMGLRRSPLGWIVGLCALCGASGGLLLQWWTSAVDYPFVISGKPLFSFQAFVPVTFGLGVLLGAASAVFGMLALSKLPMLHHPLFDCEKFSRFSDEAFFLSVESSDKKFDSAKTRALIESVGGRNIETVEG